MINNKTIDFIKKWEGCKLEAYRCPAGVWTIGIGSTTYPDGDKVKSGDKITIDRAYEMCKWYIQHNINLDDIPNLNENQRTALISFIYNIGQFHFNYSTLKKVIKENNKERIRAEWMKWDKVKGKPVIGLTKRRLDEVNLFFS